MGLLTLTQRWQFLSRFFGTCCIVLVMPDDGDGPFEVEIIQ